MMNPSVVPTIPRKSWGAFCGNKAATAEKGKISHLEVDFRISVKYFF